MSPYASASATKALVTVLRCAAMPSKSSGMLMAVMPSSAALAIRSAGWAAASSASYAAGRRISDRLEDQLLVLVGVQVEVVGATRTQTRRRLAKALHPLELTGGSAERGERRLDAVAQSTVERVAQPVPVQELLAKQWCDERQPDVGR
jgi:hypothetical protein